MTRVPETSEVSAPTEPKRFGQGAQLVKPPFGDTIASEAMDVYVERLSGQVSAPKRLRAACSDQFGLFSSCAARRRNNKRNASQSNVRNKAKRRSLRSAIQSMQSFVRRIKRHRTRARSLERSGIAVGDDDAMPADRDDVR